MARLGMDTQSYLFYESSCEVSEGVATERDHQVSWYELRGGKAGHLGQNTNMSISLGIMSTLSLEWEGVWTFYKAFFENKDQDQPFLPRLPIQFQRLTQVGKLSMFSAQNVGVGEDLRTDTKMRKIKNKHK